MNTQDLIVLIKKNLVGFCCGLVSIILVVLIYFRSDQVKENGELLQQKIAEGEKILATVKNSARLEEQLGAMTSASRELERRLVQASDLAKNLQFFYKLETDTGIKLNDIHQGSVAKPKALYAAVSYTLSAQGSYRQILDLLGRLETGPHFYQMNTFNCSRVSVNDPTADNVSLSLNFSFLGLP